MILTAVLTVVGCNKTFEMDLPLAVSSRVIDLTKDAGTTHIMIFADGDWTAKFTETTEWASLDRLNGNGNSGSCPVIFCKLRLVQKTCHRSGQE